VSSLAALGALATLLSTFTLLPHLLHAVRSGRPGGSTSGWALGFLASLLWFAYGIAVGDLVVAAPGVVTLPVGAALAVWCHLANRRQSVTLASVVPSPRRAAVSTDTLELPRIA
jgi:uncharacterized protein with PQ loop repeat